MPAANKVEVQRHDLESIWDVTHKHGEEIGELKEITENVEDVKDNLVDEK